MYLPRYHEYLQALSWSKCFCLYSRRKKKRKHINGIYYNRLYSLTYIAGGASFQLRSVCKESDKAIRRMESRTAKRAQCGFPHLKPRRRNRAPELRNAASHEGYLKLTRDILSFSSLQDQYIPWNSEKRRLPKSVPFRITFTCAILLSLRNDDLTVQRFSVWLLFAHENEIFRQPIRNGL